MDKLYDWPFLNEPIWRWFVFLIAIGFLMGAWARVLEMLKEVV